MIDRVKIDFFYNTDEEMQQVFSNKLIEFSQEKKSKYTGEPIRYYHLRNAYVKQYSYSKRVTIDFNFISFKNPVNRNSPTYQDICFAIDYISTIFAKPTKEMNVKYFEFALIVNTPETPFYYFSKYNSLRLKPFYYLPPPYNHSKPLEKYCSLMNYTVKFYDFGNWNKLVTKENQLKSEIVFKKMQKVYEITGRNNTDSPITLADFKDKHFISLISNFYFETYRLIDKQPIIDYSQLKSRQIDFVFAGQNTEYWTIRKQINRNTAKKKRTDYLKLYRRMESGGNEPHRELERIQKSKLEYLISD